MKKFIQILLLIIVIIIVGLFAYFNLKGNEVFYSKSQFVGTKYFNVSSDISMAIEECKKICESYAGSNCVKFSMHEEQNNFVCGYGIAQTVNWPEGEPLPCFVECK